MPTVDYRLLITLDFVKELQAKNLEFKVRYNFVEFARDGKPQYECAYVVDGKERLLVRHKISSNGAEPRTFNWWPGLYNHHRKFGDGSKLLIDFDTMEIECIPRDS